MRWRQGGNRPKNGAPFGLRVAENRKVRPTLGMSPNEFATTQNSLEEALLSLTIEVVR